MMHQNTIPETPLGLLSLRVRKVISKIKKMLFSYVGTVTKFPYVYNQVEQFF